MSFKLDNFHGAGRGGRRRTYARKPLPRVRVNARALGDAQMADAIDLPHLSMGPRGMFLRLVGTKQVFEHPPAMFELGLAEEA